MNKTEYAKVAAVAPEVCAEALAFMTLMAERDTNVLRKAMWLALAKDMQKRAEVALEIFNGLEKS